MRIAASSMALLAALLSNMPSSWAQAGHSAGTGGPTPPGAPAGATQAAPPLPSVDEVTAHLDRLYRSKSSHAIMEMDIRTAHYERHLVLEAWSKGLDLALIVIRKPPREAGTATLRTKKGLWTYAPRADRLMRLPPALLSESWMGSHFTNDDLVREVSYKKDYDTTVAWTNDGGKRLLEVRLTPKPDSPVVYTRVSFLLTPRDWVPLRALYYDGDEVVRTMTFGEVRDIGGRKVPTLLEVRPADKPEEFTRVRYTRLEFDLDVPASLFTPAGLRKVARRR